MKLRTDVDVSDVECLESRPRTGTRANAHRRGLSEAGVGCAMFSERFLCLLDLVHCLSLSLSDRVRALSEKAEAARALVPRLFTYVYLSAPRAESVPESALLLPE